MNIILNILIYSIAIFVTASILPGITISSYFAAIVAAVVLGIINSVLKPLMIILTLPVSILTLGLFVLVINGLLVLLASAIVPGFHVNGFWWAIAFSLVLSIISSLMNSVFKQ
jgi:putative membrane protein